MLNPTIYRPPATQEYDMTQGDSNAQQDALTMLEDLHTIITMKGSII